MSTQPAAREPQRRQPAAVGGQPGQRLGQRVRRRHPRQAGRGERRPGTALDCTRAQRPACGWSTSAAATISVINPATRTVTQTIALPRGSQPYGVAMSPAARLAFVALEAQRPAAQARRGQLRRARQRGRGRRTRATCRVSGDGAQRLRVALRARRRCPARARPACTPATVGRRSGRGRHREPGRRRAPSCCAHSDTPDAENQGRGVPNYLGAAAISPDGTQAWVPSQAGQHPARHAARRPRAELPEHGARDQLAHRPGHAAAEDLAQAHRPRQRQRRQRRGRTTRCGVYLFVALETSREVAVLDAHGGARCCASTSAARRRAWRCRRMAARCTSTTSWTARSACSTCSRCSTRA